MSRRALRQPVATLSEPRALYLAEACQRLGLSLRSGHRLLAEGRFPVPHLPMLNVRRLRFSSVHIEAYLRQVHRG